MPSHKLHLVIAKRMNEKLNMNLDELMLGSILPDVNKDRNHKETHYQNNKPGIEGTANPNEFIKKYKNELTNPIIMGYLLHLITDKYYNTYMFKNFYIYDKDGNDIGLKFKTKEKLLPFNKIKHYKHREFNLYDKWLLNTNKVPVFSSKTCLEKVKDLENAHFDKEQLNAYIDSHNQEIHKKKIFKYLTIYNYKLTTKKELDNQLELCLQEITNYLNKI